MSKVLITGGAGFFGTVLKKHLLEAGFTCVSIDLCRDDYVHPRFESIVGDIADEEQLEKLFHAHQFDCVFHCAALLAHEVRDKKELWKSNVEGTRVLAEVSARHLVKKMVFISSNCLWGENLHRKVTEDDPPLPVEIYGRSKLEGERILLGFQNSFSTAILRSPTIIDEGRLGLLTILFDFIRENRKVWVVGDGSNRYQFIYARDLAEACLLAYKSGLHGLFNVGSDGVRSLKEIYEYVIDKAGSTSVVASLPKGPTLAAMGLASALRISPLGPYQRRMIAEDFIFDTSKLKSETGWRPTMTNEEMLLRAYNDYHSNFEQISHRTDVSAHSRRARMGVLRLLKWLS